MTMETHIWYELTSLVPVSRRVVAVRAEGKDISRTEVNFLGMVESLAYRGEFAHHRPSSDAVFSTTNEARWLVPGNLDTCDREARFGDLTLAEDLSGFLGIEFDGVEKDWSEDLERRERFVRQDQTWKAVVNTVVSWSQDTKVIHEALSTADVRVDEDNAVRVIVNPEPYMFHVAKRITPLLPALEAAVVKSGLGKSLRVAVRREGLVSLESPQAAV